MAGQVRLLTVVSPSELASLPRPSGRLSEHIGLDALSARFDRDLLEEVINRTGCREKRARRLPAHVLIRYVIAMGLLFEKPYDEVMRRLIGTLRESGSWSDGWQVPSASAITQARQRLGAAPLKALFALAAVPLVRPGTNHGWLARRRLMAIDATSFDVADTVANLERFGRIMSGPGASPYPQLHVAALAECGSHAIVEAVLGSCDTGERTLAADLVAAVCPDMLILAAEGLFSYELFDRFAATGADLVWRIGTSVPIAHLRWLPDGSYLALIYPPGLAAAHRVRLAAQAKAGRQVPAEQARLVRVAEYTVPERDPDGEPIVVVTTVLDPHDIPAADLAGAYQQRWDEASALDEIKTDLCGRGEVLRSQSPDLVEQQMWGLLLAHHAIRALLVDAADPAGPACYDLDRQSFVKSVPITRRRVSDHAAILP